MGDLKLSLINIEHELIRDGYITFNIDQKKINLNKIVISLDNIGIIESEVTYEEKNGEIIFNSSNVITIKNRKNFARKFQMNVNKVIHLNKIFFKIKKNISSGIISIYDINFNKLDVTDKNIEKISYNIKNSQEFNSLVKRILSN